MCATLMPPSTENWVPSLDGVPAGVALDTGMAAGDSGVLSTRVCMKDCVKRGNGTGHDGAGGYINHRANGLPFACAGSQSSDRRAALWRTGLTSHAFARKAKSFGSRASVLEEDMTYGEIDARLGLHSAYTEAVEEFIRSPGPTIAQRLDSMAVQVAALPVAISR